MHISGEEQALLFKATVVDMRGLKKSIQLSCKVVQFLFQSVEGFAVLKLN